LASPEYSARKHHVPAAPGVNADEVAVPPLNVTAPPTAAPPLPQTLAVVNGPQTKKLTVPVGVPALLLTVAWSVFGAPRTSVNEVAVLAVVELATVTVKHSALPLSEDAEYFASPEYWTRKHHVPTPDGVNDPDTAVAAAVLLGSGVTPTALPTGVPPLVQPLALVGGPQTKKLTVPVGLKLVASPVTVAWSVFEAPTVTVRDVGALAVVELAAVTVKHSALPLSEDAEYLASPEYSARKHHVPAAFAVNDGDVAAPPVKMTAPPTAVPPTAQPSALVNAPQAKKLTVPVGIPLVGSPVTVAWSVFEAPTVTIGDVGALAVVELAAVTVKHSVLLPSEDGV
jgi:hypothetical protein